MNRFLVELNNSINSCVAESERAKLVARRAVYLARAGEFESASCDVAWLRAGYGDGRHPEVTIMTMLAEGVYFYFESLSDRAYERIVRAYALARAFNSLDCLPIVGSWLAHLEFESCRYEKLTELVTDHLSVAVERDSSAYLRFCLVLADAFLFIGDRAASQSWYSRARLLACSLGDRVSLGAVMYNRAAFGLGYAIASRLCKSQTVAGVDPTILRVEAKASYQYQQITAVRSLSHLSLVSIARGHFLCEDYAAALAIFEPVFTDLSAKEKRTKVTSFASELALCLLAVGRSIDARKLLEMYRPEEHTHLDIDDQVVLVCGMREVAERLDDSGSLDRISGFAAPTIEAYRADVCRLGNLLEPWRNLPSVGVPD